MDTPIDPIDADPQETQEWLEAMQAVLAHEGLPRTHYLLCLLYTSPSPRDQRGSRMPSSA